MDQIKLCYIGGVDKMNKRVMISIGIIFIAVLFVIIKIIIPSNSGSKELELTYQTNGSVPYEWKYEIENKNIVEFVKKYEVDNQNKEGIVGAPISINYVFKGLKEGTTTITFKYVNTTDGTVSKEEKHTIKVNNYKNISLVVVN